MGLSSFESQTHAPAFGAGTTGGRRQRECYVKDRYARWPAAKKPREWPAAVNSFATRSACRAGTDAGAGAAKGHCTVSRKEG